MYSSESDDVLPSDIYNYIILVYYFSISDEFNDQRPVFHELAVLEEHRLHGSVECRFNLVLN